MKSFLRCGMAVLAISGLVAGNAALASQAARPSTPAQLIVEDGAQFFTAAKIEEAKAIVAQSMGQGNRQVHIETYKALAPEELKTFNAAADKKKFWHDWTISKTKGDRGISIFIVKEPPRYEVVVDRQMHDLGFNNTKESELKKLIREHLEKVSKAATPEAKQTEFDATLIDMANYLQSALPATTTVAGKAQDGKHEQAKKDDNKGTSVGTWICLGICLLLGIWLVIGLVRAFSGGGAGGAGGGGFMTGLLGGLFGAMAGMWLYNSFFGSNHDSSAFGGDGSSGGDYGGNEAGGAGDYGGDQGTGGDWGGGGDAGGGDWGGGGGDFGGGGDW